MKKVCLALLAISMTPSCFAADQKQWYMGFGLGNSEFDLNNALIGYSSTQKNIIITEERNRFISLSGGYNFNEFIALEVGYVDLGYVDYFIDTPGVYGFGNSSYEVDGHGYTVASVFSWELVDSLTVSGKLGVSIIDLEKRPYGADPVIYPYKPNIGDTETEFFGGLRVSYKINESISFGVDWDHYKLDDIDVDSIYGRLGFHF